MLAAVDRRGLGWIGYDDFEAVMTQSMLRTASGSENEAESMSHTIRLPAHAGSIPFHEASGQNRCSLVLGIHPQSKSCMSPVHTTMASPSALHS